MKRKTTNRGVFQILTTNLASHQSRACTQRHTTLETISQLEQELATATTKPVLPKGPDLHATLPTEKTFQMFPFSVNYFLNNL